MCDGGTSEGRGSQYDCMERSISPGEAERLWEESEGRRPRRTKERHCLRTPASAAAPQHQPLGSTGTVSPSGDGANTALPELPAKMSHQAPGPAAPTLGRLPAAQLHGQAATRSLRGSRPPLTQHMALSCAHPRRQGLQNSLSG